MTRSPILGIVASCVAFCAIVSAVSARPTSMGRNSRPEGRPGGMSRPPAPTPAPTPAPAPPAGTVNCSGTMLLATQSGPGSSCPGTSPLHHWPLTGNTADCHGWKAMDWTGRVHRNSAKNIRCSTINRP